MKAVPSNPALPGIGHNLPPEPIEVIRKVREEFEPVRVHYAHWGESIHDYPERYARRLLEAKLKPCCHQVDQLVCGTYKTKTCDPKFPYDLFIARCSTCGCRHIRLIVGNRYAFVEKR